MAAGFFCVLHHVASIYIPPGVQVSVARSKIVSLLSPRVFSKSHSRAIFFSTDRCILSKRPRQKTILLLRRLPPTLQVEPKELKEPEDHESVVRLVMAADSWGVGCAKQASVEGTVKRKIGSTTKTILILLLPNYEHTCFHGHSAHAHHVMDVAHTSNPSQPLDGLLPTSFDQAHFTGVIYSGSELFVDFSIFASNLIEVGLGNENLT